MLLDDILENFKKYSNEIAYKSLDNCVTYEQLYNYVKNIYSYILNSNLDNKRIIIYGHKEEFMLASFLACSFAGATYIPIDSYMAIDRVNNIISEANPDIIFNISGKSIYNKSYKIVELEELKELCSIKNDTTNLVPLMKEDDIYYIIFTSGTTGIPKGVMITYKNINSFIKWYNNLMTDKRSIILNQASFSFDLSVADIYLTLSTGSKLVIIDKSIQRDFNKLFDALNESNAEIAVMTPSFAELLLLDKNFNSNLMKKLNTIYFCGEVLTSNTAKKIMERFADIRIINSYGPTECTVAVTEVEITKEMVNLDSLPIGICKEDTEIYIVDDKLNILPDEKTGEILICGESVAKGYINIQNEKFIFFNGRHGYLTGDIGYYKNGMLWYKCRKDRQIKYRGYRIELSDIEKNIYKLKYVNKVMVIPEKDEYEKVKNITAFIKLNDNCSKTSLDIREEVKKYLPEYMRPKIKLVNNFVLNSNGKTINPIYKESKNER